MKGNMDFRYKSVAQGLYGMCKAMVFTPVLQKNKIK